MRTTSTALDLENEVGPILARQQAFGVMFDIEAAKELALTLTAEKARLKSELLQVFKPRVVNLGEFVPKVNNTKLGYKKGCVFTKIKFEEYNPSSRQQTIDRLITELGWNPSEFTEKGNPELGEEIIESLPFSEVKPLKDYFTICKRLGQLEEGKQAWLPKAEKDGRIYGGILQSGAATGRMIHHNPNLAQTPANDKLYGKECRSLFRVPSGKVMVGWDADALEMRCLGGYLKRVDGGRFIETILNGKKEEGTDMHTLNAIAYRIDHLEQGRDCSKTLFYGGLYGAANPKLGLILQGYGVNFEEYVKDFHSQFKNVKQWAVNKNLGFSDKYLECLVAGKTARDNYGQQLPELPELIELVKASFKREGFLKGLDGRKLFCRSEHSAFNMLLQSCGAIIMKRSLVICDNLLKNNGLVPGRDYEFILNIHDELQAEVVDNQEIIGIIKEMGPKSIQLAGEYYKFPCPMGGNVLVGYNWSETH